MCLLQCNLSWLLGLLSRLQSSLHGFAVCLAAACRDAYKAPSDAEMRLAKMLFAEGEM